nr:hypothetical protein [uncultured Cohaesibacter sp.]
MRKAGATKLAEAGGTEFEVKTFLGHRSPQQARKYVRAANKEKDGRQCNGEAEMMSNLYRLVGQKPSQLPKLQGLFVENGTPYGTKMGTGI